MASDGASQACRDSEARKCVGIRKGKGQGNKDGAGDLFRTEGRGVAEMEAL